MSVDRIKPFPGPEEQSYRTGPAETGPAPTLSHLTYDTNDLAFVLRTSLATIHRLRAAGKLPRALKLGSQLRWRVAEVQAWVSAGMPDLKTWETMNAAR